MEIHLSGASLEQIERALSSFGPKGKQAVARALNRALTGVKTDAGKAIRKEYPGAKAGAIKKTFDVKKASKTHLMGMAKSKGHRQPLIAFGARPSRPGSRRPPIGASVKVTARKRIKGAFVARTPSGHVGLFVRAGSYGRGGDAGAEKIRELFTFAVPQAAAWIEEHQGAISEGARDRFNKNLEHEMSRVMRDLGAK